MLLQVHADALSLVKADFAAELIDETVINIAAKEEAEAKQRTAENKRQVRYSIVLRVQCCLVLSVA